MVYCVQSKKSLREKLLKTLHPGQQSPIGKFKYLIEELSINQGGRKVELLYF
jgi:hypothetical protein